MCDYLGAMCTLPADSAPVSSLKACARIHRPRFLLIASDTKLPFHTLINDGCGESRIIQVQPLSLFEVGGSTVLILRQKLAATPFEKFISCEMV